ncbi:nucleotide exchange factor GrpE [Candidatus Kaiserbacteria bacterium RIFCSPHIGHO2_01_FULL_48_10]|uniref:Protein GrpE n=1 Tax=Candidatus Kaiserbacteria bacterium RIFCSPHIGHO2_01_FULL_48_10 TaxID=1798476 RepID=A0A1F6C2D0_9BACT|nr:MAG: nucleotide exchange factor GrpE [Candidatus Kaiserbacteria bacterium RIFCSPHIGHO2_01_FULL_48_10]
MSDENDDLVVEPEAEDGEGGLKTPEQKIKELREALKKAQEERDQNLLGWQRTKADYVNAKRRFEEEGVSTARYAVEKLIEGLLPVLDSFEYALAHGGEDAGLSTGIQNIYTQLTQALSSAGVSSFSPENETFDPSRHESVETVAVTDAKMDNVVTKVHQRGYQLNGKVIRPARVAVGHYQEGSESRV